MKEVFYFGKENKNVKKQYQSSFKTVRKYLFWTLFCALMPLVITAQDCGFSITLPPDMTVCEPSVLTLKADIAGDYKGFKWSNDKGLTLAQSLEVSAEINQTVKFRFSAFAEPSATDNVIVNGSFTSGNTGFTTDYSFRNNIPFFQQELWNEGTYSVVTNPLAVHSGFKACNDHTGGGNMMVVNGAASLQKIWCQSVIVEAATDYIFRAYAASVYPASPAVLQFSINGTLLGSPLNLTPTTCEWREFYTTWQSGVNTTANICIVNQNTWTSGNDFAIDDIFFGPICRKEGEFTVTYGKFDLDNALDTTEINCITPTALLMAIPSDTSWQYVYNWSTSDGMILSPSDSIAVRSNLAGDYTVTVTNNAGCEEHAVFAVRGNTDPPIINIAGQDTINCLDPVSVLTLVDQQDVSNITWTLPGGGIANRDSLEVLDAGFYIAEAAGANACIGKDTIEVTYRDFQISYDVSVSGEIGCLRPEAVLTFTPLARIDSLMWQSGDFSYSSLFGDTVRVQSAGTYYFTAFAGESCVKYDSVRVTATDQSPPAFTLVATDITCLNREAIISIAGQQDIVYLFNGDTATQNITVFQPGTYQVEGINKFGCDSTVSVEVKAYTDPPALLADTLSISCRDSVRWLFNKLHQPGVTYTWTVDQIAVVQDSLLAGNSNAIQVVATNIFGCKDSTDIVIVRNFDLPLYSIQGDTVIGCKDSLVELNAIVMPALKVAWYLPDSGPVFSGHVVAADTGIYRLVVTDTVYGCQNSHQFRILRQPKPVSIGFTLEQPVCPGQKGDISDISVEGGTPPFTLEVNGTPLNLQGGILDYGSNLVIARDANGCEVATAIDVNTHKEIYLMTMSDTLINYGDSVRLTILTSVPPSEINDLSWSPSEALDCDNCPDPLAKPLVTTSFACTMITTEGCVLSDSTLVRVRPGKGYLAPNILSGNGESNGRFTIYPLKNSLESISRLQVFDRWGGLLFEGRDLPPGEPAYGWDGTSGGKPVQAGVYVWVAILRYHDGSEVMARGNVTFLR